MLDPEPSVVPGVGLRYTILELSGEMVKSMPVFAGILKDKDMKNVAQFVATFK